MPRHSGCYLCGSTQHETLLARHIPGFSDAGSVAICPLCDQLPQAELKTKVLAVQAVLKDAQRQARERGMNTGGPINL